MLCRHCNTEMYLSSPKEAVCTQCGHIEKGAGFEKIVLYNADGSLLRINENGMTSIDVVATRFGLSQEVASNVVPQSFVDLIAAGEPVSWIKSADGENWFRVE